MTAKNVLSFPHGGKEIQKYQRDCSQHLSLFGEGCVFHGKMCLQGCVRLGGAVFGDIFAQGSLTLESSAYVEGNIICENLMIQGKVKGNIEAHTVTLLNGASVLGEIVAQYFQVEHGAILSGSVQVGGKSQSLDFDGKNMSEPKNLPQNSSKNPETYHEPLPEVRIAP